MVTTPVGEDDLANAVVLIIRHHEEAAIGGEGQTARSLKARGFTRTISMGSRA